MKPKLILILTLLLALSSYGQDNLPSDTADLLEKLKEFSQTERDQAEQRIQTKQAQVVEVLRTHLDRETKSGNLDRAIKIKAVIDELSQVHSEGENHKSEKSEPKMADGEVDEDWFVEKTWKVPQSLSEYSFKKKGDVVHSTGGKTIPKRWKLNREGIVEVSSPYSDSVEHFKFSSPTKASKSAVDGSNQLQLELVNEP